MEEIKLEEILIENSKEPFLHRIGFHRWKKERNKGEGDICFSIKKTCSVCGIVKEKKYSHDLKISKYSQFNGSDPYVDIITKSCKICDYSSSEEDYY